MTKKRKKQEPLRQWIVPMRFTQTGECIVDARTAAEAKEKAEALDTIDGIHYEAGELVDWEVCGEPEVDE